MDHALLALCALLLNAVLGGPRRWYAALGATRLGQIPARFLRALERKLNRQHRSTQQREWRGMVLVMAAVPTSIAAGAVAKWMLETIPFAEVLLLAVLLPVRPTWDIASHLRKQLSAGNLAQSRNTLKDTQWRHYALLDEHGLARAGIEILAVCFLEKILSPVCWYLLFGLPGLLACKTVTLMQETYSRPPATAADFGKAAIMVHGWMHWLPARIAFLFWFAARGFLPRETKFPPVRALLREVNPQRLVLLAASSALGVSLGGPTSVYVQEWIGGGPVKALPQDITRALFAYILLNVFLFLLAGFFL